MTEEKADTLKWSILACKKELGKFLTARGLPYGQAAVAFQISSINETSTEAKRFLDRLANDPDLDGLIFCNNDQTVDAAVRLAGSDGGVLNTWVCAATAAAAISWLDAG